MPTSTQLGVGFKPSSTQPPLPGKAFGYLKRVRVTPGLQRRFARLYPGFTYRQWPGFSPRTHPLPGRGRDGFVKLSQVPLVTATCGPEGVPQDRRHPLSRSYGANLPSSLAWGRPEPPWAFHPGAPASVLGTGAGARSPSPFHGPQESGGPGKPPAIPAFSRFSPLRHSPAFSG